MKVASPRRRTFARRSCYGLLIGAAIGCLFVASGWSGGGEAREAMVLWTYQLAIPCGALLDMVMHPESDRWLAFVLIAWALEGLLFGVLFGLDGREQD